MTSPAGFTPNPALDLVLDRVIDVPPALVWKVWTTPEHLVHWFCPRPWSVSKCEIDLRPGGVFKTIMRSPEGQEHPNEGCYLEIVPNQRLVWTDALLPGYRPSPNPFMTASLVLAPHGQGTRYIATAMHRDEETRARHEEMGFLEGWGTVLTQMVDYITAM